MFPSKAPLSNSNVFKCDCTYKSHILCDDVMVDLVLIAVVCVVLVVAQALTCQAGVVVHKSCPAYQQMQNETHQLHADGDEEKDDGVLPLVFNQQLGEDPTQ